jgi:hypothetical protein
METYGFFVLLRQIVEYIFKVSHEVGLDNKPWPDDPNTYRGASSTGLFLEVDRYGHVEAVRTPWGRLKLFSRLIINHQAEDQLTDRLLMEFGAIAVGTTSEEDTLWGMTEFMGNLLPIPMPPDGPVDDERSREQWAQFTALYEEERQK